MDAAFGAFSDMLGGGGNISTNEETCFLC